ncbi:nitrous oxide reductase accessory protein NosL [Sedimenticola selenatireducens]|nr:nitrous oxide reductase accessory protein NosL [Sedimenticola selenatireducens]
MQSIINGLTGHGAIIVLQIQIHRSLFAVLLLFFLSGGVTAETLDLPAPKQNDTCPVCGMFVAKYPAWIATVQYQDEHLHHFDGTKDLFKYLLDMPRWAPGHRQEDIKAIGVTEYYTLTRIDMRTAYYVIGSDVLGPMGHELIPLETEADAREFLQDHKGIRILRHDEVTRELLEALDKGQFAQP